MLHHLFTEANGNSFAAVVEETEQEDNIASVEFKADPSIEKTEGPSTVGLDNREGENVSIDVGKVVKEGEIDKVRVRRKVSRSAMQSLTPVEVAVREPILLPTRFGEEIFRSWSTVECSAPVLKGSLDLFAGEIPDCRLYDALQSTSVRIIRVPFSFLSFPTPIFCQADRAALTM